MAGDRERTRVLAGSDEPTRAVGAGAPAAAAGTSGDGTEPAAGRRLWPVVLAVLAVLLLAAAIWLLLDRDGGDAPADDAPADDGPEVVDEDPVDEEEEPEDPADEEAPGEGPADPAEPDETPPDDTGPPDESEDPTLDDLSDEVFEDPDAS